MQPTYLSEKIKAALAKDPGVGELGIEVQCSEGRLYLIGQVATEARRQAIVDVVSALAPDVEVCNDVAVTNADKPPEVEQL